MNKKTLFSILILGLTACQTTNSDSSTSDTVKKENSTESVPPLSSTTIDSKVNGIDISHFQGDEVEFLDKKKDLLTFVICKSTEGLTGVDTDFKNNWVMIKEKGYTRGAYHFYHCSDDPTLQANHYLSILGKLSTADFPPIVDFEELSINKSCNSVEIQKNLLLFLKILTQKTGRKPLLYTDNNIGKSVLNDPAFSTYDLWIANYTKNSTP